MKKFCEKCGEIFETIKSQQKYCSQECAKKAKRALEKRWHELTREKKPAQKKVCEVCGKEFETNIPNQTTCSAACQKKHRAEYQKLWREVYCNDKITPLQRQIYQFRASAKKKGLFWAGDC